jgi:hypothetical protein
MRELSKRAGEHLSMNRLTVLIVGGALFALAAGCTETTTTTTTTAPDANGNTVVTNSSTTTVGVAPANENANTNAASTSTTTRSYNANINRADYEKEKDRFAKDAQDLGSRVGAGVDDGWLWTKTRAALLATNDVRSSTINVDVENGVITLRGTVANAEQRAKAVQVAKSIDGQKGVRDELKINPHDSAINFNLGGNENANANRNTRH